MGRTTGRPVNGVRRSKATEGCGSRWGRTTGRPVNGVRRSRPLKEARRTMTWTCSGIMRYAQTKKIPPTASSSASTNHCRLLSLLNKGSRRKQEKVSSRVSPGGVIVSAPFSMTAVHRGPVCLHVSLSSTSSFQSVWQSGKVTPPLTQIPLHQRLKPASTLPTPPEIWQSWQSLLSPLPCVSPSPEGRKGGVTQAQWDESPQYQLPQGLITRKIRPSSDKGGTN